MWLQKSHNRNPSADRSALILTVREMCEPRPMIQPHKTKSYTHTCAHRQNHTPGKNGKKERKKNNFKLYLE